MSPKKRRYWTIAGHVLTIGFVAAVGWLIAGRVKKSNWEQVGDTLMALNGWTLAGAALLAAVSYCMDAGYERLARLYAQHDVGRGRVAAIAFVCYAFNLNSGVWVGGVGFRYLLCSRHGLRPGLIARIAGMSIATNWLGYGVLGGA